MDAKINRRVSVTKYNDGVSVMLSWYEVGKVEPLDMHSKHFRFSNPSTFGKIEQAINLLVNKWAHIFLSGMDMSSVSYPLDENPKRFDWLVETIDSEGETLLQIAEGA